MPSTVRPKALWTSSWQACGNGRCMHAVPMCSDGIRCGPSPAYRSVHRGCALWSPPKQCSACRSAPSIAARIGRLVTVGRTVGVAGALEVATPGLVVATAESREQSAPLRLNRATSSARARYFWHGWFRPIMICSPNLSDGGQGTQKMRGYSGFQDISRYALLWSESECSKGGPRRVQAHSRSGWRSLVHRGTV